MSKPRPKHLNLFQIRLPLPALVSILHRASGAALFLLLPLLLYWLQRSLESPESYAAIERSLANPLAKLILLGGLWAYLHHLAAGIRHLALDLDYGTELAAARATSIAVLAVSLSLTLIVAVALW
jgi:succinate dehydrogenase / fumarate reductase, cytochrome b subunit